MLNFKTLALATALAAASVGAHAQSSRFEMTPDIDARQERQAARIDEALRSGRLSQREARELEREQRDIRRYERRAKADGVVTYGERRELQRMLDRASRNIRGETRDGNRY